MYLLHCPDAGAFKNWISQGLSAATTSGLASDLQNFLWSLVDNQGLGGGYCELDCQRLAGSSCMMRCFEKTVSQIRSGFENVRRVFLGSSSYFRFFLQCLFGLLTCSNIEASESLRPWPPATTKLLLDSCNLERNTAYHAMAIDIS